MEGVNVSDDDTKASLPVHLVLGKGVIKKAATVSQLQKEFYIPHKSVICNSAETTKMQIIYDASA